MTRQANGQTVMILFELLTRTISWANFLILSLASGEILNWEAGCKSQFRQSAE